MSRYYRVFDGFEESSTLNAFATVSSVRLCPSVFIVLGATSLTRNFSHSCIHQCGEQSPVRARVSSPGAGRTGQIAPIFVAEETSFRTNRTWVAEPV